MCPGWSFQSLLLGTIYDTSLDNYIQWVNKKVFLSNRSPPQHFLIKQFLILMYRCAVQEAPTLVKIANICCCGLRYGNCEWGNKFMQTTNSSILASFRIIQSNGNTVNVMKQKSLWERKRVWVCDSLRSTHNILTCTGGGGRLCL